MSLVNSFTETTPSETQAKVGEVVSSTGNAITSIGWTGIAIIAILALVELTGLSLFTTAIIIMVTGGLISWGGHRLQTGNWFPSEWEFSSQQTVTA